MVDKTQLKRFRAIGHHLNPVVTVAGNGLSEAVLNEINRALSDHELIKVRIHADDRDDRKTTIDALIEATAAELIQKVGNVALIYKPAAKPRANLSNLTRTDLL